MKRYGLIGFPLGHSFSASYFADKFAASSLTGECLYENFPIEQIETLRSVLPADIRGCSAGGIGSIRPLAAIPLFF